jgi:hypothetical protein
VPALQGALAGRPSAEVRRRLGEALRRLTGLAEEREHLRALAALEHAGTPDARTVLEEVAAGKGVSRLAGEAKAALQRLSGHSCP